MRSVMGSVLRAAAVAAAVGLTVTACGGPGGGAATTNDGACAAVLPLARSIVHDQGTPILIRRINDADTDRLSRELGVQPPPPQHPPPPPQRPPPAPPPPTTASRKGPPTPKTCLVVYQGHYPPGAIAGARPPATSGTYALMVLRVRRPAIERVLVTSTLPADTVHRSWWQRLLSAS